jgi:hypothetical protein
MAVLEDQCELWRNRPIARLHAWRRMVSSAQRSAAAMGELAVAVRELADVVAAGVAGTDRR